MLNLILLLAFNACAIVGVHFVTRPGELFGWAGDLIRAHVPPMWQKPLTECPPCMSSVWGTLGFAGGNAAFFHLKAWTLALNLLFWLYIPALCGLLRLLNLALHRPTPTHDDLRTPDR